MITSRRILAWCNSVILHLKRNITSTIRPSEIRSTRCHSTIPDIALVKSRYLLAWIIPDNIQYHTRIRRLLYLITREEARVRIVPVEIFTWARSDDAPCNSNEGNRVSRMEYFLMFHSHAHGTWISPRVDLIRHCREQTSGSHRFVLKRLSVESSMIPKRIYPNEVEEERFTSRPI